MERAGCSKLGKRGGKEGVPKPALDPRRIRILEGLIILIL